MTESSSNRIIKESLDSIYVTSSYLSETASIWGQPQIITPETVGQVTSGVYVHVSPGSPIGADEELELWKEIKIWEEASVNDLLLFEKRIDEE